MKIGIDARFVGRQGTGIGKYTEKLIVNLQKIDSKNEYTIFLKESNWGYLKLKNENFKKTLANISWYSVEEQLKMPSIFDKQKLDLLHVPHFNVPIFYKGKFVVTIHDLIHQKFAVAAATTKNRLTFKLKKIGYQRVINNAIKKAQKIIVPSNFVKREIMNEFELDDSNIVVTYEAAEDEYFKKPNNSKSINQNFILYVGNAYPYKNLHNLLKAIKLLKGLKLKIVCPRDIFWKRLEKEVKASNLENRVTLNGYMETSKLLEVFTQAKAYVSPSLSEGFGIPALNAMACNLPVVASNIPISKEVYSNAALYFDPNSPKDIANKINTVLKSKNIRQNLIKSGNAQVKKYSWEKMAKETLKIYDR